MRGSHRVSPLFREGSARRCRSLVQAQTPEGAPGIAVHSQRVSPGCRVLRWSVGETELRAPIPRPGRDYMVVWQLSRWFVITILRRPLFGSLRPHTRAARVACDQGPIAGGRRPARMHGRAADEVCDQHLWDFLPPLSRVPRGSDVHARSAAFSEWCGESIGGLVERGGGSR